MRSSSNEKYVADTAVASATATATFLLLRHAVELAVIKRVSLPMACVQLL